MEFLHSCPEFEWMLVRDRDRSDQVLVSEEEQERRFQDRMKDPTKRWKLSAMGLQSQARWAD